MCINSLFTLANPPRGAGNTGGRCAPRLIRLLRFGVKCVGDEQTKPALVEIGVACLPEILHLAKTSY
jgi:hypothetical protein